VDLQGGIADPAFLLTFLWRGAATRPYNYGVFSKSDPVGQRACSRLIRARKRAAYRRLIGEKWHF